MHFFQNACQKWKWKNCKTQQVCEASSKNESGRVAKRSNSARLRSENTSSSFILFLKCLLKETGSAARTPASGGEALRPPPQPPSSFILSGSGSHQRSQNTSGCISMSSSATTTTTTTSRTTTTTTTTATTTTTTLGRRLSSRRPSSQSIAINSTNDALSQNSPLPPMVSWLFRFLTEDTDTMKKLLISCFEITCQNLLNFFTPVVHTASRCPKQVPNIFLNHAPFGHI